MIIVNDINPKFGSFIEGSFSAGKWNSFCPGWFAALQYALKACDGNVVLKETLCNDSSQSSQGPSKTAVYEQFCPQGEGIESGTPRIKVLSAICCKTSGTYPEDSTLEDAF